MGWKALRGEGGGLKGMFGEVSDSAKGAANSKKLLEAATLSDDKAERAKAVTAGVEKEALAGVGEEAEENVGKMGKLASARAFLSKPLSIGGMSIPTLNAFGQGGGQLSMGGAAMSAGLGLGAASLTLGDSKALGLSDGQSELYAGITGAMTTGVSAIFPPARLIFAGGEAIALGVDKLYSERLERQASMGTGAENSDTYGAGAQGALETATKNHDRSALARVYAQMSEQAEAAGDHVSAQSYARQRDIQKDLGTRESTNGSSEYIARILREAAPGAEAARNRAQLSMTPEAMAANQAAQQADLDRRAAAGQIAGYTPPQMQARASVQNGRTVISFADLVLPDPHGATVRESQRRMDNTVRRSYG